MMVAAMTPIHRRQPHDVRAAEPRPRRERRDQRDDQREARDGGHRLLAPSGEQREEEEATGGRDRREYDHPSANGQPCAHL